MIEWNAVLLPGRPRQLRIDFNLPQEHSLIDIGVRNVFESFWGTLSARVAASRDFCAYVGHQTAVDLLAAARSDALERLDALLAVRLTAEDPKAIDERLIVEATTADEFRARIDGLAGALPSVKKRAGDEFRALAELTRREVCFELKSASARLLEEICIVADPMLHLLASSEAAERIFNKSSVVDAVVEACLADLEEQIGV